MPLETATYIPQLVATNPAHSDGLNNADAHARMIKGVLQATFPNFTAAALASTQAQLDGAASAVNTNGVAILADTGAHFKTNTTDGLGNPAAGEVDIMCAGVAQAKVTSAGIAGGGTVPIGSMVMWLTDTLPTGNGTWAWANGGTLSRTTYATLYGLWGTTYGAGDGTTTFNVINMQEVVPVGKSTMGGAASPGLLPSIAVGVKGVLNGLFGSDTHTMTSGEMPSHRHSVYLTDPGHAHQVNANSPYGTATALAGGGGTYVSTSQAGLANFGTALANTTGITVSDGAGTQNVTAFNGSGTAFNITQPSRAVNFIIRVA